MFILNMITFAIALYVAYQLVLAGEQKLAGNANLVGGFEMVGEHFGFEPNLFRRVIGLLEIGMSALLIPTSTRSFAAVVLAGIMSAAIYSHIRIFKDEGQWSQAGKLLALLIILLLV